MSQNLLAAIEQEDKELLVRPMVLTRLGAGITASAKVEVGHLIEFDGLQLEVIEVIHRHEQPGSPKAPTTLVHGKFIRPLADEEIEMLKEHGFKDL
jgi:hypothetical protein